MHIWSVCAVYVCVYMHKGRHCGLLQLHWAQFWEWSFTISLSKHAEKISLHKHMATWCLMRPQIQSCANAGNSLKHTWVCVCMHVGGGGSTLQTRAHSGFLPVLCLPTGLWSSAAWAEKESEGGPRVSDLEANQICSSAGTPNCVIKPEVLMGLNFISQHTPLGFTQFSLTGGSLHSFKLQSSTQLSSHLPLQPGTPLRARGQSRRSQNYYYFCVMTREKERRSEMKVNRAVGVGVAGFFPTTFLLFLFTLNGVFLLDYQINHQRHLLPYF